MINLISTHEQPSFIEWLDISNAANSHSLTQGYGIASYPSTPVTPSTLFLGGSTTKAFTAAAMALLISSGNFSSLAWDTPIATLIRDDFVLRDPYLTDHVTIEDALSHRTGMPRHDFSYGGVDERGEKRDVRDLVRSLRELPVSAGVRVRFQYCNMMFVVVSYVVERLMGVWLGDFLRERIWEPLGMRSTVCLLTFKFRFLYILKRLPCSKYILLIGHETVTLSELTH